MTAEKAIALRSNVLRSHFCGLARNRTWIWSFGNSYTIHCTTRPYRFSVGKGMNKIYNEKILIVNYTSFRYFFLGLRLLWKIEEICTKFLSGKN